MASTVLHMCNLTEKDDISENSILHYMIFFNIGTLIFKIFAFLYVYPYSTRPSAS